jgi:hypothetical protein
MKNFSLEQPFPVEKPYYFAPDKSLVFDNPVAEELIEIIDEEYARDPVGHFQKVAEGIRPPINQRGPNYAIYQDFNCSKNTALVVALPFTYPIRPDVSPEQTAHAIKNGDTKAFDSNDWNSAEKHYFLFRMMRALGIRDTEGNTVPVIAVASPSKDWKPVFKSGEKAHIKNGDFAPLASNLKDILDYEGFGRIHIGGYSMGAAIGHAALANFRNFDIQSATLGEPTTYKHRSRPELIKNYVFNSPSPKNKSGIESKEKWTQSGPQSRKDLEEIHNHWQRNMVRQGVDNGLILLNGLRQSVMFDDLDRARKHKVIPLTIEFGSTSSVTHDIKDYLKDDNEVLQAYKVANKLRIIETLGHEAVGAPHLHGESPLFYALWMSESILWALDKTKSEGKFEQNKKEPFDGFLFARNFCPEGLRLLNHLTMI